LSKSFSLIGGASTSLTTLPALSPTMSLGNLVQSRTSSATVSFGVGSYGGGDILLGVQLGYGWGQAMAVNPYVLPNEWAVVDTRSYSAMLIFAGATSLRSLGRAAEKVKDAVTTGNPESSTTPPADGPGPPKPGAIDQPPSTDHSGNHRELPRSGASDPRNGRDARAPDAGSLPSDTPQLPSAPLDPHNRSFPPK
jgi:hypothetical protein